MDYEAAKAKIEALHAAERVRRAALTPEEREKEDRERLERRRLAEAESPFRHPEMRAAWYDCGPFEMVGRAWYLVRVAVQDLVSGDHTEVRWNKKGCRCEVRLRSPE